MVSLRAVTTSTGSTAMTLALASAAGASHTRRTTAHSSGTETIPASISGNLSVVELSPNSFTLTTCSHRSTGGLSIDTLPPGSNAPKKKLCQEDDMLRTAAS